MSLVLDAAKLEKALALIQKNPKKPEYVGDLIVLLKPIISLTRERFPQHLGEDLEQEIRLFILKRADYIAKSFFEGKIKNCTSYFFTVCRNTAINHMKKETKNDDRLIPLEDVKIEPVYKASDSSKKQRIIDEIRVSLLEWCKDFYRKTPRLIVPAQKFVAALMSGKRPSFNTKKIRGFSKLEQTVAKDMDKAIERQLQNEAKKYIDELLS